MCSGDLRGESAEEAAGGYSRPGGRGILLRFAANRQQMRSSAIFAKSFGRVTYSDVTPPCVMQTPGDVTGNPVTAIVF